ncbi:MAG: flagellar basal body P-ring protein FlgI, partial [Acetobacteraceae bacterium]
MPARHILPRRPPELRRQSLLAELARLLRDNLAAKPFEPATRSPTLVPMPRLLLALMLFLLPVTAAAQVRIKDIADVQGVRDNQLIGYGLVVGLNNTGDKLDNAIFTRDSLVSMLERLGVNTQDQVTKLETKNVAAVMV